MLNEVSPSSWPKLKHLSILSSESGSTYNTPINIIFLVFSLFLNSWRLIIHMHSQVFNQRLKGFLCSFLELFLCIAPSSPELCSANPRCTSSLSSDLSPQNSVTCLGSPSQSHGLGRKVDHIVHVICFPFTGTTVLFCWLSSV